MVSAEDGRGPKLSVGPQGHVIVPFYSKRLRFQRLRILNPPWSPYTDAFDPTGCSDVVFR